MPANRLHRSPLLVLTLCLGLLAGLLWTASPEPPLRAQGVGEPELIDLDHIDTLRQAFNADYGKTRIILLLSPT